jgi:hypothetical protein
MLTWYDITGVVAYIIGGGIVGYSIQMARHHWSHRNYHIVFDDDHRAVVIRGRR